MAGMGKEARLKAQAATTVKIIEANEQERVAMAAWFSQAINPKERVNIRRHEQLFVDFDLDAADEENHRRIKAQVALQAEGKPVLAVRFQDFDPELVEYETTKDVVDYFLENTLDRKEGVAGNCARFLLHVGERMLGTDDYKAPSVKAAEAEAAQLAAVPEDKAAV